MTKSNEVIILAIETSCDETSIALVKNGREILASLISSQIDIHQLYGGVVPEIASRNHLERIISLIDTTLKKANVLQDNVDAIAVTYGPGLVGALLVGVAAAKALSFAWGKPLIAVHHIEGHIFANFIADKTLQPPFVALVISGGHTALVAVKGYNEFSLLGQTRDDAAGEVFDKVARVLNLPYPGGPEIENLARNGNGEAVNFPRIINSVGNYEFSFSGLKSAVLNYINNNRQKGIEVNKCDIAASFQCAVADTLVSKAKLALENTGYDKIVIAGGVAANKFIQTKLKDMCEMANVKLYVPAAMLCTDNAEMIACRAYYQYLNGDFADLSLNAVPVLPIGIEFKG